MNILDIITAKKNGEILSYDELKYAFNGYLNDEIPDYQMSALLMAITINGMNMSETLSLTDIFIKSGDIYDLTEYMDNVVDKHSTGGVGDTTTLVIGPVCAALGLHMAKTSGRGLGLTGGTVDKIESIPGFKVALDEDDFYDQVRELGFALTSQTQNVVPLDKKVYALRDVTGTTESIPLIAASIMSKKIAAGANNILIDIKVGTGALIKTEEDAKKLSKWLIAIGDAYKKNVKTIISNMDTPLSYAIGNALEVGEVINVLRGKKCPLYDKSVEIAANLLALSKDLTIEEATNEVEAVIENGQALKSFCAFVKAQNGRLGELTVASTVVPVKSKKDGIIKNIDALGAAKLAAKLGASKMTLDDEIDHKVGILLNVKIGDRVEVGDKLLDLYMKSTSQELEASDFDFIEII